MANRKRRGRGEGSISQRADGLWVARITTGYDSNGKRKRRTVYGKTKREAQEKLAKLQNESLGGTLCDPNRLTVGEYLARWLEESARVKVRPSTLESYQGMVKRHITPRIGGVKLQRLTALDIEGVFSAMERAGKSPRMRQYAHAILRRAMKQAVRWGLLARNVCDAVEPPKVAKQEIRPLDAEEVKRFLRAARGDRLHALYVLAVATGARQGELFGLQWADVDLKAGTLQIRRTAVYVSGKLTVNEPKSAKGRRQIKLPAMAVDALLDHRKRMLAEGHAGAEWVFCNATGGMLRRPDVLRNSFRPALDAAGVRRVRFHDLRHTAATLMLSQGIHPRIAQEMLGHSTINLTLDTYSHVLPTMQDDAASRMDLLLADDDREAGTA